MNNDEDYRRYWEEAQALPWEESDRQETRVLARLKRECPRITKRRQLQLLNEALEIVLKKHDHKMDDLEARAAAFKILHMALDEKWFNKYGDLIPDKED